MKKSKAKLSPRQLESPDTLDPQDLAQRQAALDVQRAEQDRRRGFKLLASGARLLASQRPLEAAADLEEAAILLPDNVDVAINLGGAYIMLAHFRKAVTVLAQAAELAPDNAMVWTNLAAAHLGTLETSGPQQQAGAIAAYKRALSIDPSAPNVNYNLGLIHVDRKEWDEAAAQFQAALALDPHDRDAHFWLEQLPTLQALAANKDESAPESRPAADRSQAQD